MLFNEALNLLKSGVPVHRATWTKEDGYLKLMPGMHYVWKIVLLPNPNAGNFIFSIEDFSADDWQKFEVPNEAQNEEEVKKEVEKKVGEAA